MYPDEMYILKTDCQQIVLSEMAYHGILLLSVAVLALCVFNMYVAHVVDNLTQEIHRERLYREIRDEVVKNV